MPTSTTASVGPGNRSAILFFIPGNPGLAAYYAAFFAALQVRFPTLHIVASNHLGFDSGQGEEGGPRRRLLPPLPPADQIDLTAQIAHKVDILDGILLGRTRCERESRPIIPVFLVGHSVGGYIATQVLKLRPEAVNRVYLLFPTLNHIAASPQGLVTHALLRIPGVVWLAVAVTVLFNFMVPRRGRQKVVRWFTGFPGDSVRVTMDEVLQRKAVYSALTLAASEMREIRDLDEQFWQAFGERCSAYWAASGDRWVAETHRGELLALAEGMESHQCPEAPHAFCIRHGDLVADKVGDWLERDLEGIVLQD